MNINLDYTIEKMVALLKIPSPSGDTEKAISFVENEFKELGISTMKTIKGALIGTIVGENDDIHRTLSAHVDTLGAMVKEIKSDGRLKLTQVGGYDWNSVEGEHCTVETMGSKSFSGTILHEKSSTHVYGAKSADSKREMDTMEVRLDERVKEADDTKKLGINVGDFVYFDPRTTVTETGFVKSRHLDDKACVACILGIIKYLKDNNIKPKYTTHFFISNFEEVGHGSSASIPPKTTEFLAIDMAAPGDGQESDEYSVTICAKDSTGPYDLEMKNRLVRLAKEANLDYKIDIYPYYGSDASAALRAGWEIKHGLIGPGVDASHSHERLHKDSVTDTIKLGILYLTN